MARRESVLSEMDKESINIERFIFHIIVESEAKPHYLKELNPKLHITYKTEREYYPFDFISVELQLRSIPFDVIDLNGKICKNSDSQSL